MEIGGVTWGEHPVHLRGGAECLSGPRGLTITQYQVVVTVNRLPFIALVNFSSWPAPSRRPCDVFVNAGPDFHSFRVVKTLEKAAAQAMRGEFKPTRPRSLALSCPECMKPATEDEFKKALMLPSNARLAVSGNWALDLPCADKRPADVYAFCLIHGRRTRTCT